jgi:hypothetical protein
MIYRLAVTVGLVAASGIVLADFVPEDVVVSDPSSDVTPPEFDARTMRMIWQDRANRLWLADVDPVTGDITPVDGKGTMLDDHLSPGSLVQNTPRYTYGSDGAYIAYNKVVGDVDLNLAMAEEIAPDVWVTTLLENGADRWKANGSPEETTDPARIVYNRLTEFGTIVTSWRDINDPATEQSAAGVEGGRFLGAEPSVIIMTQDEFGIVQIYNIPFDTGVPEQVTFGDEHVFNAFIWYSPEFEDYLVTAMVNFARIGIYRRIDGEWTEIHDYRLPTLKPFLSSEEAFIVNGKTYMTVVAADELGSGGFLGQPVGPTEIWVTSIDPDAPFFRRIDDPTYEAQRAEPEPFTLRNGVVIYHSELVDKPDPQRDIRLLKRAQTGLSDQTGYASTAYGGPWSSALRNNRNCACTPYEIASEYEVAGLSVISNAQFMHPVLGPEGNLYFGMSVGQGSAVTRSLVAVDTATNEERYRLGEAVAGKNVSATTPLIGSMGEYYVAADDGVSKFNSKGERQWRLPTKGLAKGPQFLADGNVVFFTWNGWAYVVSPAGERLLEKNVTPGRPYPADPTCLRGVAPGNDCSYIGPPAVDVHDDIVYATQVRRSGDSVVQAFKYSATPVVSLTNVWGAASPTVPGIGTTPVLSADYNRLYVHDGAGDLQAIRTSDASRAWTFPLGFVSDQPPAASPGGYLLPGGTFDQDARHDFVGLIRDRGASAEWLFKDTNYAPRSFGAAGDRNRFVLAARDKAADALVLLVLGPDGVVSSTPWGTGLTPSTLKGVTLRDDGWVFVQTLGKAAVKVFKPAG